MAHIFELVNQLFAQVVPVADFLWDFPTNIDAYANIPILGQLSIAFLLLLGGSLYFTLPSSDLQTAGKSWNFPACGISGQYGRPCGSRKYCRCNRSGNHWWTGSDLLDVGFRIPGNGNLFL